MRETYVKFNIGNKQYELFEIRIDNYYIYATIHYTNDSI